ncbi:MAG: oxygenase MpaB family protein, partial [Raineya sp.]
RASVFFSKYENIILYLLGVLSLPYCYAARKGVQVLFLSKRLQNDTFARLKETALFVLKANSYDLENESSWKNEILKIRLLHALLRIFTRRSGKWQAEWGEPINQEDMAGTNLSFSYIVLRGMRKLGFAYTQKEAEDFLHLWNVVGNLLGVQEGLLPNTMQEAFWLDKQISEKEFEPSKEGQMLCKSLIEVFSQQSPSAFIADFALAQMRFLLGDAVADILNIPQKNISRIIPIFTLSENTASWLVPKGSFRKEISKNNLNF